MPGVDRVVVATDDDRIAAAALGFGAEVAMTPDTCRNGTERCAVVSRDFGDAYDIVVNLQGDAPLTPPWFVSALIEAMQDRERMMATPVLRCDAEALAGFLEDRRQGASAPRRRSSTATAGRSTSPRRCCPTPAVPSARARPSRSSTTSVSTPTALRHSHPIRTGRRAHSRLGRAWSSSASWRMVSAVHCVEVEARGRAFWELNNPTDVPRIEAIFARARPALSFGRRPPLICTGNCLSPGCAGRVIHHRFGTPPAPPALRTKAGY